MSAQTEEIQEVELTDNEGKTVRLSCSKQIVHLLFSPDTDSNVKEMVVQQLLGQVTKSCSQTTAETSSDNVSKWSSEAEKLVLEKFSSLEKRTSGTRHKWKVVAEEINKFGYDFTGEQCRLKIKSLKEKYERGKKKSEKSGESPPDTDSGEDLLDVFETCPDMKPSCVIESGESDNSKPLSNPPADISDRSEPKGTTKRKSSSSPPSASSDDDTVNQSKRPKRSVDVMKAFLGDVLQKREEAVERRHKENIEAVNSLIGVLKDTLKK